MKRTTFNYFVDLGLIASFFTVAFTGVNKFQQVLRYLARHNLFLPTSKITAIHKWGGIILFGLVLVHIVTHWKWIMTFTGAIFGKGDKK